MKGCVYLIHLEEPLVAVSGLKRKQSRHYLGYTARDTVDQRFEQHQCGKGSMFLREANRRGIKYSVVATFEFDDHHEAKAYERKLKNRHHHKRLCPICAKGETQ